MKVFFSLSLYQYTVWSLYLAPVAGSKLFQFGTCVTSININEIRDSFAVIRTVIQARDAIRTTSILSHPQSLHSFQDWKEKKEESIGDETEGITDSGEERLEITSSLDRCCLMRHIVRFYLDKVFRYCETENLRVSRKISGIANSFLGIEKKLRQCENQRMCNCGSEAMNKYQQIIANYEQMDVTSAAVKSLGELDILLDWLEAH